MNAMNSTKIKPYRNEQARAIDIHSDKGIALLITLLLLALLTAVGMEFFYGASIDLSLAKNYRDKVKASYLARGGLNVAIDTLNEDGRVSPKLDALNETWAHLDQAPLRGSGGKSTVKVIDLSGLFNPNSMVNQNNLDKPLAIAVGRRLLRLLHLDDNIVEAMADWIDTDNVSRSFGRENPFYLSLTPPYRAKNGYFDTKEELRKVYRIDNETYVALAPFVTVHSGGKININTAPKEIIESLSEGVSPWIAENIIDYRQRSPFTTVNELKEAGLITSDFLMKEIAPLLTVSSSYFQVESVAELGGVVVRYRVVLHREGSSSQIISFQEY